MPLQNPEAVRAPAPLCIALLASLAAAVPDLRSHRTLDWLTLGTIAAGAALRSAPSVSARPSWWC